MSSSFSTSVLIADDSAPIRKALRNYLEILGFDVSEATDGIEAVEQAFSSSPDVVVLDLAMPRMNGFDAARKLHGLAPKTHLIMFTLYADLIDRPEAPGRGHRSGCVQTGRYGCTGSKHIHFAYLPSLRLLVESAVAIVYVAPRFGNRLFHSALVSSNWITKGSQFGIGHSSQRTADLRAAKFPPEFGPRGTPRPSRTA